MLEYSIEALSVNAYYPFLKDIEAFFSIWDENL
jgi:hypothetical protein